MRAHQQSAERTPRPPKDSSTAMLLLGTIADTTWRMFVPIIGGLFLGLWIDTTLKTLPLAMIGLTIIGTLLAITLVRRQLNNVRK